jgi:hypothetical protein
MNSYHLTLKPVPSKNYLNSVLRYEKETGFVYWRKNNKIVKGCINKVKQKYKRIMINKEHYLLHRIIYQMHYGDLTVNDPIDHIDRNRFNNRIENLRKANVFLNNQNQGERKNNTSGYKGVSWSKQRQKWRATITVKCKHKTLGFFESKEKAYECYLEARKEFYVEIK